MFGFDPGGTVYGRINALAGSDGMVGFALDALRLAPITVVGMISKLSGWQDSDL